MRRVDRVADWLPFPDARARILNSITPLEAIRVPVTDALGRALAEPVRSSVDLPAWDNSAMDGFAVRAEDVRGASPSRPPVLRVVEDIAAGAFPTRSLGPGEATRVMTGAPVPDGADSVIRVEHTDGGTGLDTRAATVEVRSDADAGRNIRSRGEDVRTGQEVLASGTTVGAAAIGVAAAVGAATLTVVRSPRVAVLATGDELVGLDAFAEVESGRRIVSSNSYTLAAQLREIGAEVVDLGIAPDDPAAIRDRLRDAHGCDAVVTSAGISVGVHDHLQAVMAEFDTQVAFWRVRMRPGSPFAFGSVGALGGIPWFGLPGNPVSSMVTFEVLVRPALLRMSGHVRIFSPAAAAHLDAEPPEPADLTHFLRVRLRVEAGRTVARPTGSQGSGILTSMVDADALLVIAADLDTEARRRGSRHPVLLPGAWPPVRDTTF
jgi:molybdopterin molybdotransferase